MAHGKDPAWSFYSADYLLDPDVLSIEPAHEGALIRMWSVLWLHGRMPIEKLRTYAPVMRCDSSVVDMLAERFLVADEDGALYSERMEAEREERAALSAKKAEAGRRGGKATAKRKRERKSSSAEAELEQCSSSAAAKSQPSASASASGTPIAPSGGRDDAQQDDDGADVDPGLVTEAVARLRIAGVRAAQKPLVQALTGFFRDDGTEEALERLIALSRGQESPGGLLWTWVQDAYAWKSALADQEQAQRHNEARRAAVAAANEQAFRDENGLAGEPLRGFRLEALKGGAA